MMRATALAVALVVAALPLSGQSVTIRRAPDNSLRLIATYHTAHGDSVPTRSIQWTAASPGVVLVAMVPGMWYGRQVSVAPATQGGTWLTASVKVSGRVVADSVYVVALIAARDAAQLASVALMAVQIVHPVTSVNARSLTLGPDLQPCVQFFQSGASLVADTCASRGAGLPYRVPYALALEVVRAFTPGRTFIIAAPRR